MDRTARASRLFPWLIVLALLAMLAITQHRGRTQAQAFADHVEAMDAEIASLQSEARTLRTEIGRIRLEMAAKQQDSPRDSTTAPTSH